MGKFGRPSNIIGLSVISVAVIVHVIVFGIIGQAVATVGAGLLGALLSAIGFFIIGGVVTTIDTGLTKARENILAGYLTITGALILGNLVRMAISTWVTPYISIIAQLGL